MVHYRVLVGVLKSPKVVLQIVAGRCRGLTPPLFLTTVAQFYHFSASRCHRGAPSAWDSPVYVNKPFSPSSLRPEQQYPQNDGLDLLLLRNNVLFTPRQLPSLPGNPGTVYFADSCMKLTLQTPLVTIWRKIVRFLKNLNYRSIGK